MATSYGPQFPGIEEGLIICFDPKNRDSWKGGAEVYNVINTSYSASAQNFDANSEWDNAITDGGYINLDGSNDYLKIAQSSVYGGNLNGLTSFTVQVWFRSETVSGPGVVLGNWKSGTAQRSWQVRHNGTAWEGNVSVGGAYAGGGDGTTGTDIHWIKTSAISADTWYCGTFYLDGSTSPAGVGGNISSTSFGAFQNWTWDYSGTMTPYNASFLAIGDSNSDGGNGGEFTGDLGPLMVYNRALSTAEMETNYNRLKGRFGL